MFIHFIFILIIWFIDLLLLQLPLVLIRFHLVSLSFYFWKLAGRTRLGLIREVLVLQSLFGCDSLVGIECKHLLNQVKRVLIHPKSLGDNSYKWLSLK